MKVSHFVLLCSVMFLGADVSSARAGGKDRGFLNKVFKDSDGESKYVLFIPHGYDGSTPAPTILFLHGSGESGIDGLKQAKVGIGPAIQKREKDFPFIVVMPQSKKVTWKAGSPDADRALAILEEVKKTYKVDEKRLYLTGLSMGGIGTWSLAIAHPDRWAAIVPICGYGDPRQAEKIKDVPCWGFIGDKDNASLLGGTRDMIAALKKAGGAPRYDEYPGVGHNSWDRAYGTEELYTWLLKHSRKKQ